MLDVEAPQISVGSSQVASAATAPSRRRYSWVTLAALALAVPFVVAGCARVRPYQREVLAEPGMQSPVWPDIASAEQHVHEVREGSTGATGQTGGGCGCN
ncbi:MAG: DUF4266 domain-containing protein [Myxococcales bacterium]|nr:DUF4266 domain-containing protein [Myxococcales bacterium]MDD9969795.1 DUF4266 domain-containing protein [Myxococcales bacterium]